MVRFLQIYSGKRDTLDAPLSPEQWQEMWREAVRQSLVGILHRAVRFLPSELNPPRRIKISLALAAEKIAGRNELIDRHCAEITRQMNSLGLECCVLKGQGYARRYPSPEARTCGDIDLWVKGDMKETLLVLRRRWKTGDVFYHHTGIHPFEDNTEVEVHFRPSWMNSPFTDRKLQEYFDSCSDRQFGNRKEGLDFSVTETGFDSVFCAVHIYRHLLQEGVGLRQVMDYYYVLLNSSLQERDAAAKVLSSLGMSRFVRALMFVLKEWFLLDEKCFLLTPDEKYGRFLMNEIMLAGNFGKYDSRYSIKNSDPLPVRAVRKMRRLCHLFGIAPSEVFWAPCFKVWQHLWRLYIRPSYISTGQRHTRQILP